MRIAVIGSGIAGLTVSRLLIDSGHEVTLFERFSSAGIDAHSVEIKLDGRTVRADVPSRMFNDQLWPSLCRFYERIGVEGTTVDLSQSFSQLHGTSYLKMANANRPASSPMQLLKPRFRKLLGQAVRLRDGGLKDLQSGLDPNMTFGEYLDRNGYPSSFVNEFLYPTLSSTVFTCSYASLDAYPAMVLLEALQKLNRSADLWRAKGGSRQVVSTLLPSIQDARFSHTVNRVQNAVGGVEVEFTSAGPIETRSELFEHVVMATQANTATRLLPGLSEIELEILGAFAYESVPIFVHTDDSLMPADRKGWATFNMVTNPAEPAAMCSVWLNRYHDDWQIATPVFQSINAFVKPKKTLTLSSCTMQRPVVNRRTIRAVKTIDEWHNEPGRRVWFCGSYASAGTPLLESGVVSALTVAQRMQELSQVGCGKK